MKPCMYVVGQLSSLSHKIHDECRQPLVGTVASPLHRAGRRRSQCKKISYFFLFHAICIDCAGLVSLDNCNEYRNGVRCTQHHILTRSLMENNFKMAVLLRHIKHRNQCFKYNVCVFSLCVNLCLVNFIHEIYCKCIQNVLFHKKSLYISRIITKNYTLQAGSRGKTQMTLLTTYCKNIFYLSPMLISLICHYIKYFTIRGKNAKFCYLNDVAR